MMVLPEKPVPTISLKKDTHVHTRLCNHATGEMEDYILAAIGKDLESITFLEHLEAGIQYFERTWLTEDNFIYYFQEGKRLQKKYHDQIEISLGVEVGYNPLAVDQLIKCLNNHVWDTIGISYHFLFDGEQYLNMVSRRQKNIEALAAFGPSKVITNYFEGLINAVQELDGDVLCHLDAVMRHYPGLQFQPSHWDQVERLLQLMQNKGMALEINTSGFTLRNIPYPSYPVVQRALELGIQLVAGSDAHRPDQIGRGFDLLPAFLNP
jgi:histidinol-phosphatase (PHP family)